jgi:hypothetical protein
MDHSGARTLLEFLVQRSDLSIEEQSEAFATCARKLGERVGLSPRQLGRWMAGEIRTARPAARRVAKCMWGHDFAVLVGPVGGLGAVAPVAVGTPAQSRAAFSSGDAAGGRAVEMEVVMAAAESARFAQFADQSNVGPHTLEQFRDDIQRIVTNYGNRPVYPTLVEVRELRNRAFELLEGRQRPGQASDLYLVAGLLCAILGEASHDLGLIPAAKTQLRTAFMCAELAGSNWLRACVRGKQSIVAYWDDQPRAAAELAADGWQYVPEVGAARVFLATSEARAWARLRDERATDDALARAERARAEVQGDDDPGGTLAFSPAMQASNAAHARLLLGEQPHFAEAELQAARAVELFESDPPERRQLGWLCLARLNLAAAQLGGDNLESAAANVGDVLNITAQRPSETVTRRLFQLSNTLERPRYQNTTLAADLRDQIRDIASPVALPRGNDA